MNHLWTVEYSPSQGQYHVDYLEDTARKRRGDWEILHIARTWEEAHAFADRHRLRREGRPWAAASSARGGRGRIAADLRSGTVETPLPVWIDPPVRRTEHGTGTAPRR